jgi:hypothetical protein
MILSCTVLKKLSSSEHCRSRVARFFTIQHTKTENYDKSPQNIPK